MVAAIIFAGVLGVGSLLYISLTNLYESYQPKNVIKPPSYQFSINQKDQKVVDKPSAVQVFNGRIYVGGQESVQVFSRNGRKLNEFSLRLKNQKLYRPYAHDLTVDESGSVYVVVGPQNRILVFNQGGDFEKVFPGSRSTRTSKNPSAYLGNPISVFYESKNNTLLVSDLAEHAIKRYKTTGRFVKKIGRPGEKSGQFMYPNGVLAAKDGTVYVAESNNSRVQKFKNGRFVSFLEPPKKKSFVRPKAIAIDKLGRVHVVDSLRERVLVFAKDGRFLFEYGEKTGAVAGLSLPNDISIDRETGQIFIAERGNNRVSVWAN